MKETLSPKDPLFEHLGFLIAFNKQTSKHYITAEFDLKHLCKHMYIPGSVATVMTDVFQENGIMISRKLAKVMMIFVDI